MLAQVSFGVNMDPIRLEREGEPASTSGDFAKVILAATESQTSATEMTDPDALADFVLSTDALNFHRVEWRIREEIGAVDPVLLGRVKVRICQERKYDPEEFEAALAATQSRPRLPYGWTAMDVAVRRLATKPIRLLNEDLEASRYAKGVVGLAVHLQDIQGKSPILLPVEQVREILKAKKVVIAGTIMKLVDIGLLEMTKATYNTGSAREFLFKGEKGKDYVFLRQKPK